MAENNITTNGSYEFTFNMIPLTVMSVTGAVLNALLLVAFIKDPLKCFRNSGTYLVMNLTVSDWLTCIFSPVYFVTHPDFKRNGSYSTLEIVIFILGAVSFISITSISIDRFLLVAYPIKHRILKKRKYIILWLAATWIVSCFFPLVGLFYSGIDVRNIGYIFSVFVIILTAVVYVSTYYKFKKQSRNVALRDSTESRAQEIRILKEKRFLKTIIIIACIAFVSTVPFMLFFLNYSLFSLPKDNLTSEVTGTATLLTFLINHAVNPLIYILRLPSYRKTFYLLYCKRKSASS